MPSPNEIKKGTVIRHAGELWITVDFQRVSPGKGSSFVRTRLKNLKTGKVREETFKSAETLEFEDVAYKKMQYLFNDGTLFTFMDNVSFEQVTLSADSIGEDQKYLQDGQEVMVIMHGEVAIAMELPQKVTYTVASAEPAVKGDTASGNVQKNATADNGLEMRVPIFIKEGDKVVINTATGEYVERVS